MNTKNKTATDTAIDYLHSLERPSLAYRLQKAVMAAMIIHGDTTVDSYKIADAIFEERCNSGMDADWDQTKDYVQFLLREADYVCGHAIESGGRFYRIHEDERCGEDCKARNAKTTKPVYKDMGTCPDCFTKLPAIGICDCK